MAATSNSISQERIGRVGMSLVTLMTVARMIVRQKISYCVVSLSRMSVRTAIEMASNCLAWTTLSSMNVSSNDGAVFRYNTIYRPTHWVARILQESRGAEFVPCRKGEFANNLVVYRSDELRTAVNVGGGTMPETFVFSNNYWSCIDNPRHSEHLALPVKEHGGRHGVRPQFVDEQRLNLSLRKASTIQDAGVRP